MCSRRTASPARPSSPFYGEAYRQGASPDDRLIDQAVEIDVGGTQRSVADGCARDGKSAVCGCQVHIRTSFYLRSSVKGSAL